MFVKSLLVLTLGAISVAASPIKPQDGTSEAALRERSLIPDFMSFDKREVDYAVKRSAFADIANNDELALEKRAPKKKLTAKQRAARRRKAAAKKAAARKAAKKAAKKAAAAAARKQAAAAAAAPAAAAPVVAAVAPARAPVAAVAAPAAVVAAAAAPAVASPQEQGPPATTPAGVTPPGRAAAIAAAAVARPPGRASTFCSSDQACNTPANIIKLGGAPAPGSNEALLCNRATASCYRGCQDGFGQVNGACVQNQVTCGNDFCGSTDNGVYTCSAANTCQLSCDTAGGYTDINGQCLNTQSDVNACGASLTVCPGSYNGVGSATCINGRCGVFCPAPTYKYTLPSGAGQVCLSPPS